MLRATTSLNAHESTALGTRKPNDASVTQDEVLYMMIPKTVEYNCKILHVLTVKFNMYLLGFVFRYQQRIQNVFLGLPCAVSEKYLNILFDILL